MGSIFAHWWGQFSSNSRIPRKTGNWVQRARVRSQRDLDRLMAGIDQGREQKSSESTVPSWKVIFRKKYFVPYIYKNEVSLLSKAVWVFFTPFLTHSCENRTNSHRKVTKFLWGALLPNGFFVKNYKFLVENPVFLIFLFQSWFFYVNITGRFAGINSTHSTSNLKSLRDKLHMWKNSKNRKCKKSQKFNIFFRKKSFGI